jgi:hypothetical protein
MFKLQDGELIIAGAHAGCIAMLPSAGVLMRINYEGPVKIERGQHMEMMEVRG